MRRLAAALVAVLAVGCGPRPPARPLDDAVLVAEELEEEGRAAGRAAYARGTYLREQGDIAGAVQLYARAVRLAPQVPELRLAYAELLVESGRPHDAVPFLSSALQRFGGSAREHLLLARLRLLGGDEAAARAGVDSAIARDPALVAAWLLRGRLLLEAGRADEACASFQRADSLAPRQAGTLEALGECSRRRGEHAAAMGYLEQTLRLEPARASARRTLAALYRTAGRDADARRLVLAGVEIAPDDPEQLDVALDALLEASDLEAAATLLRPYHERDALPPRVAALYGRLLLQLGRLAAADSVLEPLAGVDEVQDIDTLLGDVAARDGRTDDARAHYRRAMEREPENCVPAASLALLEVRAQRDSAASGPAAAVDSVLAAAERAAGDRSYRCHLLLGLAHATLRRWPAARRHLVVAHELDPENGDVLLELAMAEQELGNYEDALSAGRRVLGLQPENAAALNFVGYIQAERGQALGESETLVRRALELEPENGYFVDSLGWVLYQKGEYARATVELERAVHLTHERDGLILEHLGDAYVEIGRLADAHRVYALSQQLDPRRAVVAEKLARVAAQLGRP